MEYAARVPPEMKIEAGQGKAVFKSALKPYLDDETLYRKKQGFTPPVKEWMRGPLKDMFADVLLSRDPAYGPMLRREAIAAAWDEHQAGRRNWTPLLWAVMAFEMWARTFLTGDVTAAQPAEIA
jgi:asparagine synthase (glutamine-hydrolysing)